MPQNMPIRFAQQLKAVREVIRSLTILLLTFSTLSIADEPLSPGKIPPARSTEVACFSPDEDCARRLAKFLESATKSIDVAIYDLNEDQIVHQLLVKSKVIAVRVLVDRRQSKRSHSAVPLLMKAGVKVRFGHQRGIMHNKFAIVDGARIETGSFNYTHHATSANQENQLYLYSPDIIQRYKVQFEKVWRDSVD